MDPLNWIATMRGPEFLVLYSVYCLIVIALAVVWSRRCDPLPFGTSLPGEPRAGGDPYELAWLRDGRDGMLQTALVSLTQRGFVQVLDGQAQRTTLVPQSLRPVEQIVYTALQAPRSVRRMLDDYSVRINLANAAAAYEARFRQAGLATTPTERTRVHVARGVGIAAVLGLGLFKLMAAISTGHYNVLFLILIAIVTTVVIALLCRPLRLNARGRAYLKQLTTTYTAWRMAPAAASADVDMLPLYVGLLGTSVLAGTEYDDLNRQLHPQASASGGSSGCGSSSCSGGGSSDGGGGSSCGGGGCGGCGGGGCGG